MGSSNEETVRLAKTFAHLVELHDLHGLLFQRVEFCDRRSWLHLNRIDYAHLDERMQLGVVLHDLHKPRDHSVEGLIGIAPDRVNWEERRVIETKGTAGARAAVSMQTRFYALMLSAATGSLWSAANEIIGKKKMLDVSVTRDNALQMISLAKRLGYLSGEEQAPEATKKPICESCSYRHICGFA